MAKKQTEFSYHNIKLYKSESLGSGSYGMVCKAKCDGLLCAAKIMHPTLYDSHDPGSDSYLHKFQQECDLLSSIRHPNIVQYLATYHDPDTKLPVLLMELCDGNLTAFLERSPGPLSYHTQINICHDIILALVYLHSKGLIHRDLTGNNVLIIAGIRVKITDFGMSKLASGMTALTQCPGNRLYMSPEALDEAGTANPQNYTTKLDIFSFGVIVIQVLTRLFPEPTNRFRSVSVPNFKETVRALVPETERREAHLKLISETNPMKSLAYQCLKKENVRPSASQLSDNCFELKQSSQYTESMHQTQSSSESQLQQAQIPITVGSAQKNIRKITWKERNNAPEKMSRGAAVIHGNITYFRPSLSKKVYMYQNSLGKEQWSELPDNPNENFGLVVIHAHLTSVGGVNNVSTNTLLSLTEEDERKQWSKIFPPMPTPRQAAACITTEEFIIVAGGHTDDLLDTVDVMNINTKKWTTVTSLPRELSELSGVICGDTLYLAGGVQHVFLPSRSVFSCSLSNLLPTSSLGSRLRRTLSQSQNVWKQIKPLPVVVSTLASFNAHLLAIGGWTDSMNPTSDVYRYDFHTDSWDVVSQMKNKRSLCFAVTHPKYHLIVVGGFTQGGNKTDTIEILQ